VEYKAGIVSRKPLFECQLPGDPHARPKELRVHCIDLKREPS
jgi:hypothetical protein